MNISYLTAHHPDIELTKRMGAECGQLFLLGREAVDVSAYSAACDKLFFALLDGLYEAGRKKKPSKAKHGCPTTIEEAMKQSLFHYCEHSPSSGKRRKAVAPESPAKRVHLVPPKTGRSRLLNPKPH